MKKSAVRSGTVLLLALGIVSLWASGCTDPVAALGSINATSGLPIDQSVPDVPAHTHRCTIPLSDVNDPPPDGKPYDTTNDAGHKHSVFLTHAQLVDLQVRNAVVDVVTTSVEGHRHQFLFER